MHKITCGANIRWCHALTNAIFTRFLERGEWMVLRTLIQTYRGSPLSEAIHVDGLDALSGTSYHPRTTDWARNFQQASQAVEIGSSGLLKGLNSETDVNIQVGFLSKCLIHPQFISIDYPFCSKRLCYLIA